MKPFEYLIAHSVEEACGLALEHAPEVRFLAGGTDLLVELRRPSGHSPRALVDISAIQSLRGIASSGTGGMVINPLATHAEVGRSDVVHGIAPSLAAAARGIGSVQIRNRGTIGGNIMNAAACADTVPTLMALGASLTLRSAGGSRRFPLSDFFVRPYLTKAAPGELLVKIEVPGLPPRARGVFVKLGRRNALSIARLSVATILATDQSGVIRDARIVPGAAFPVWQRITEAERMLLGELPSSELFRAAGERVSQLLVSVTGRRWSTEYKEAVIGVLVKRALQLCAEEK